LQAQQRGPASCASGGLRNLASATHARHMSATRTPREERYFTRTVIPIVKLRLGTMVPVIVQRT